MTRADRLLLLVAIIAISVFAFRTWQPSINADRVEIISPFEHKTVSLRQDKTLFVAGALGRSEIRIAQHRIRFIDSPCTTKFCVLQGWASHSGELRVCLPNKVSLRLLGSKSPFDSLTF